MINTAPKASNSVNGREKCFKSMNFPFLYVQGKRGPVVWGKFESRRGNFVFFVHFFLLILFLFLFFYSIFSLWLVSLCFHW